jgi:deoxyribodipyrimidine photo-lyase
MAAAISAQALAHSAKNVGIERAMIQRERVKPLNSEDVSMGSYVLYWMQASQRSEYNHALDFAILRANELNKPVVVYFGLTGNYPEANQRHYHFMLEGLKEVQASLAKREIKMVIHHEEPHLGVVEMARDACLVVVDRGYLKLQREWRKQAAKHLHCPLIQVETDVLVPVEVASSKEEYSAATFRPKIRKELPRFLVQMVESQPKVRSTGLDLESLGIDDIERTLSFLKIDRGVSSVSGLRGGTEEAKRRLDVFLREKLDKYEEIRNDPTLDGLSCQSPYLHFGQISPLYIALRVLEMDNPGTNAYLEELTIRRELSMNFVYYNGNYDSLDGLPGWARNTLSEHANDTRAYTYSVEELENAQTHDPYWNAAQQEMRISGKMHGYMRMYWGKKIIEWGTSPQKAFEMALQLNNKYELDGRDPNGFAGVAWCFGKHDRPWQERPVTGKLRYMSEGGLRRKFDADRYVAGWTSADLTAT